MVRYAPAVVGMVKLCCGISTTENICIHLTAVISSMLYAFHPTVTGFVQVQRIDEFLSERSTFVLSFFSEWKVDQSLGFGNEDRGRRSEIRKSMYVIGLVSWRSNVVCRLYGQTNSSVRSSTTSLNQQEKKNLSHHCDRLVLNHLLLLCCSQKKNKNKNILEIVVTKWICEKKFPNYFHWAK